MLLVELPPAAAVLLLSGDAKIPKLELPTNGAEELTTSALTWHPKKVDKNSNNPDATYK